MYLPLIRNDTPSTLFNLISEEQWEDAAKRVKYYPKEVKQTTRVCPNGIDNTSILPLHHACSLNPTLEITESLLQSYPVAAQKQDSLFKRLPIHVACLHGASSDVIRELLVVYRDGAKEKMRDGKIPLHYACGSGASKETVSELLKAFPEGSRCKDKNGWLPIHVACLQNASVEVVELLLESYPESVAVRSCRGNTPIQCLKTIQKLNITNVDKVMVMLRRATLSLKEQTLIRSESASDLHSSISKPFFLRRIRTL